MENTNVQNELDKKYVYSADLHISYLILLVNTYQEELAKQVPVKQRTVATDTFLKVLQELKTFSGLANLEVVKQEEFDITL